MNDPKRHHYVPEFYLKGFVGTDGCLAVLDRASDHVRLLQPSAVTVEKHFYAATDERGRRHSDIERALASVEGVAAPILRKLTAREPLNERERKEMSFFLGLLSVRTPAFINSIRAATESMSKSLVQIQLSTVQQAVGRIRDLPEHKGRSEAELRKFASGLVDFVQSDAYEIDVDQQYAMLSSLDHAESVARCIHFRDWSILRVDRRKALLTSDAPVVLINTSSDKRWPIGFASRSARICVPLDSHNLLVMEGQGASLAFAELGANWLPPMNMSVARRSFRFLIGRDERLVRSIANRAHLKNEPWRPHFTVS